MALVFIVLAGARMLPAQHARVHAAGKPEQSVFGAELERDPVQRPVALPRAALDALSKDERVSGCLEDAGLRPEQLPARWFIASQIQLNGPAERDLIVMSSEPPPDAPAEELSRSLCLGGANTAPFWVLRETGKEFILVFSQMALGMRVLPTRTNGFRDLTIGVAVGGYGEHDEFQFNGRSYQTAKRSSELIGAELPSDLSGYEKSEPLLQRRGEPSAPVRAKARAWLWEHWKAHKLSYLKLQTFDDDGTDETCAYFIGKALTDKWQVTLKIHRVHPKTHDSASLPRGLIEDELLTAEQVHRVEPDIDSPDSVRILPHDQDLPAEKYKLQFLDYAQRTVASL